MKNSQKIINDPLYGFITLPSKLIVQIIDHPYFQRLRRISQLGLTDFVYPGAVHTRFHHAIGAMHLMGVALNALGNKGYKISEKEREGALIAILLHDIGHGPFSHALELGLLSKITHEELSIVLMEKLNEEFGGRLSLGIEIFKGNYKRKFFHQLVSSQLDVDRLDYLNRDCFYTGVTEGKVSVERILKMLELDKNEELVVEEKGIYSIENFLNARRLMYWQVYLHKTVISAEFMLLRIVQRAKELTQKEDNFYTSKNIDLFLNNNFSLSDFKKDENILQAFTQLDDSDIWHTIKQWSKSKDKILQILCKGLLERYLFKVELSNTDFSKKENKEKKEKILKKYKIDEAALHYMLIKGVLSNNAYIPKDKRINIKLKNGKIIDISKAVDLPNIKALSKKVQKYFMCWPRGI